MPEPAIKAAGGVSQLRLIASSELDRSCEAAVRSSPQGQYPVMKGHEDGGKCSLEWKKLFQEANLEALSADILRKEVIQPQVPLRLPCYDFTPVAKPTVVACLSLLS